MADQNTPPASRAGIVASAYARISQLRKLLAGERLLRERAEQQAEHWRREHAVAVKRNDVLIGQLRELEAELRRQAA